MTNDVIRVGIIGADARASWAGASHVPALAAHLRAALPILPDGTLTLVARAWAVRGRQPD